MAKQLEGKRIAFLATDGFEQSELEQPWNEIKNAGATVELLSVHKGSIQGMRHMDKGDLFEVDGLVSEADAADYDGLVLPGGVANPDTFSPYELDPLSSSCATSSHKRNRSPRFATARGRSSRPTRCAAAR